MLRTVMLLEGASELFESFVFAHATSENSRVLTRIVLAEHLLDLNLAKAHLINRPEGSFNQSSSGVAQVSLHNCAELLEINKAISILVETSEHEIDVFQ
jgi:hypothetical protein